MRPFSRSYGRRPTGRGNARPKGAVSRTQEEQYMRTLKKLLAGAAVVASATAMAIGPALADPINGSGKPVVPKETDVVGVGSDTIEFLLDQLSFDYNKSHSTGPRLYSWDALNPKTGLTDN